MAAKKRAETIRYEENPFIEGMVVPIKGQKVQLSRLGRDDNVLVNQATGEVQGTHITTFKRVDSEQFVKLFTANIALTFELGAAGIKAFGVFSRPSTMVSRQVRRPSAIHRAMARWPSSYREAN